MNQDQVNQVAPKLILFQCSMSSIILGRPAIHHSPLKMGTPMTAASKMELRTKMAMMATNMRGKKMLKLWHGLLMIRRTY
uniref:Uncharacterized protein n=1 Tax=Arundo donax TaxID=35708 RepID=A0A0A9CP41_ARUDO